MKSKEVKIKKKQQQHTINKEVTEKDSVAHRMENTTKGIQFLIRYAQFIGSVVSNRFHIQLWKFCDNSEKKKNCMGLKM